MDSGNLDILFLLAGKRLASKTCVRPPRPFFNIRPDWNAGILELMTDSTLYSCLPRGHVDRVSRPGSHLSLGLGAGIGRQGEEVEEGDAGGGYGNLWSSSFGTRRFKSRRHRDHRE